MYACSRFVHQVVLSMVTGAVGLAWGWRLSTHLDGLGLMMRHHVRGTAVVVIIAVSRSDRFKAEGFLASSSTAVTVGNELVASHIQR